MELAQGQEVFLAGIGGVSMSGLAHALLELGFRVSGSDVADGETLDRLRAAGARVHVGHAASNLGTADVVVRSTAVPETSPEVAAARERGLPVYHRSELLAWMCRGRKGIAIAGTHGKSTTTAMVGTIFIAAGKDPTVFVGAESPLLGGNYRIGRGEHVILEACESDGSFVNYVGCSQVITNIEPDHLDQHGTMEALLAAFRRFAEVADPQGYIVFRSDCPQVQAVVAGAPGRRIPFSLTGKDGLSARGLATKTGGTHFELLCDGDSVAEVHLPVLGEHNVLNALGALGCALGSGLDLVAAAKALEAFQAVGRRFEEVPCGRGIRIVDDYAHHPTEIRATLATARAMQPGRVIAIFQPHLRSRTRDLLSEFGRAFSDADEIILTDIYQPRDDGLEQFDVEQLLAEIRAHEPGKPTELVRDQKAIASRLFPRLRPGDLVLTIGAGDVWKVSRELAQLCR